MFTELTAFQRDLLIVVAGHSGDRGTTIKASLDTYYGSEINNGRFYPVLRELEEMGLVEIGSIDDRTNSYSLTEEGEQLVEERRSWENEQVDFNSAVTQ